MQKTLSMVSIALEWIGQFSINGLPELYYYYCYPHWPSLVLQNRNGTAGFIHIREGLMQGYPLAMATYVIFIIPLINTFNRNFLTSPIPGMLIISVHSVCLQRSIYILIHKKYLTQDRGITPNPLKLLWSCTQVLLKPQTGLAWVIVLRFSLARVIFAILSGMTIPNVIGCKKRTETWEQNITKIRKTVMKYPQESYAAVVCAIQLEWIFLQRVTKLS